MRLNKDAKSILFGNIYLLDYCNKSCIDMAKLKKCNIEVMGKNYIFVLSKEDAPISKQLLPLDMDLLTQPDVVLIAEVDGDKLMIQTTEKTMRVI